MKVLDLHGTCIESRGKDEHDSTLQGYLAHKKHPFLQDYHRALGIGLLQGPMGVVFLMSEVPLDHLC